MRGYIKPYRNWNKPRIKYYYICLYTKNFEFRQIIGTCDYICAIGVRYLYKIMFSWLICFLNKLLAIISYDIIFFSKDFLQLDAIYNRQRGYKILN
jgi:hypothetical protein